MKKCIVILLLAVVFCASAQTTPPKALWPIKGAKTGDNVIGKPGIPIRGEANYGNLFIAAAQGTEVVAPADGVVTSFCYFYYSSLIYCMGGSKVTTTDAKAELDSRKEFAKDIAKSASNRGIDVAQYVSVSLGIATAKGETFYIQGLRPVRLLKTGDKVKTGDVVGAVGYAYAAFKESHISISRSVNGKSADPMGVLGMPSTFKATTPRSYDYYKHQNPLDSLKKDFALFRRSLEEVHPGLYDYTSKVQMDSLLDATAKNLKPMTSQEFGRVLRTILKRISDSHTDLAYITPPRLAKLPPVLFGYTGKEAVVLAASPKVGCKKGDVVVAVDGRSIDDWLRWLNTISNGAEGYNELPLVRSSMAYFSMMLFAKMDIDKKMVDLKLKNGRLVTVPFQPISQFPKFRPNSWASDRSSIRSKMLNATTAYLDINSFELNQVEEDSVECFVSKIQRQGVKNLVVDVRDNRGGSIEVGNRIISYFIDSPRSTFCYKMVKSNTTYPILKYSESWTGDMVVFPEFKAVAGKPYFYSDKGDTTVVKVVSPSPTTHFSGNIYILANEYSTSMASDFPAALLGQPNCKIVGRETGSSYYQMNAEKFADIPMAATGLTLHIPMVKCVFRDTPNPRIPYGHGVIPDYNVPLTLDELTQPKDVILGRAMEIIEGKEAVKK